jgi:hypothetical protein
MPPVYHQQFDGGFAVLIHFSGIACSICYVAAEAVVVCVMSCCRGYSRLKKR